MHKNEALYCVTSKYGWYRSSKIYSPSWQAPQPGPRHFNWIKAGVMIGEDLHVMCKCFNSGQQASEMSNMTNVKDFSYLINLEVCPIEWKATSHGCSAWYLHKMYFDMS